ncbi:hypothetical protein AX774_g135 [Zancudomyces culisetae]|uniref:Mitochondrial fusion and transport protein ugo1 n=1 Tax=Zancudomyces culisetae TaxID=1213189 RepID=A0A1R1PZ77_ZANCU|nr:hypothetical protein AX774_g135 [Zancudomyces culisetae]|eukprot:OMH86244.1 hypothetical protein AX774_g135 [Zancudomyces culisetae]
MNSSGANNGANGTSTFSNARQDAQNIVGNPFEFFSESSNQNYSSNPNLDSLRVAGIIVPPSQAGGPIGGSGTNGMAIIDDDDFDVITTSSPLADFNGLVRFAGLRLGISMLSNPVHLSQTLIQVQYKPKDMRTYEKFSSKKSSRDYNQDSEFAEIQKQAGNYALSASSTGAAANIRQTTSRGRVGSEGYAVSAVNEYGKSVPVTQPYQIETFHYNKFSMLKDLIRLPTEGVTSLFKGSFTKWFYEMSHLLLQPTIEGLLNEMLGLYDGTNFGSSAYYDMDSPSALTLIASHILVGYLLSPLEILRTRLEVQSSSPIHRKYNGIVEGLKTINREESLLHGVYLNPRLSIPCILQHSINPIFNNLGNRVMEFIMADIDYFDSTFKMRFLIFIWRTLNLLVTLPVDTARKRLMCQPAYTSLPTATPSPSHSSLSQTANFKDFRTVVKLSPVPYTGLFNCFWRILTEEGGETSYVIHQTPSSSSKKRASSSSLSPSSSPPPSLISSSWGVRGLFPGFINSTVMNLVIFGLGFIDVENQEISL